MLELTQEEFMMERVFEKCDGELRPEYKKTWKKGTDGRFYCYDGNGQLHVSNDQAVKELGAEKGMGIRLQLLGFAHVATCSKINW